MTTSVFVNLYASPHWRTLNLLRVFIISSLGHSSVMFGATTLELLGDLCLTGQVLRKSVGLALSTKAVPRSGSIAVRHVRSAKLTVLNSELFVSDKGSNLYSMDLRTGNILYGYKGSKAKSSCVSTIKRFYLGISGAVISIAPTESYLASVALDRYCRIHSTVSPPPIAGSNMETKCGVLEKTYLTTVPTAIAWDGCTQLEASANGPKDGGDEEDDIWENMEHVS